MNISEISSKTNKIFNEISKVIIGQNQMIKDILIGLYTNSHVLLEGVPGLAKTKTISTFAKILNLSFTRMQFTPDLLPSDLIGTRIYNQKTGDFEIKIGPINTSILLADEINRAPAKVQSALLEAMQERQVTIAEQTFILPRPFLVLATQNPIEQEGTYPLPEAQIDRFLIKSIVKYPSKEEEIKIVQNMTTKENIEVEKILNQEEILEIQQKILEIYVDEKIIKYVVEITEASRYPEKYNLNEIKHLIEYGISPRGSIGVILAAKANAAIDGRDYVIPEDIKEVGYSVLRHRIIPSYEAESQNITADDIIKMIFDTIQVP